MDVETGDHRLLGKLLSTRNIGHIDLSPVETLFFDLTAGEPKPQFAIPWMLKPYYGPGILLGKGADGHARSTMLTMDYARAVVSWVENV